MGKHETNSVTNRMSRSTSGSKAQKIDAAEPRWSANSWSLRRRYPTRPSPPSTQTVVRQAQTSVAAELTNARTKTEDVGECWMSNVVFPLAPAAAVEEPLSNIARRRSSVNWHPVDDSSVYHTTRQTDRRSGICIGSHHSPRCVNCSPYVRWPIDSRKVT